MDESARHIERIEARRCVFALPRPFRLGHAVIDRRDYIILNVTDSTGAEGHAFALARGAPTDLVITELLSPRCADVQIERIEGAMETIARRLQPHAAEGVLGRAMSLLDVALWDLRGKHDGMPVHRLLGGRREFAPAKVVEGYPIDGESDAAFVGRMLARVDEGYHLLKVAFGAADPLRFTTKLQTLMQELPSGVVVSVDAAWSLYDLGLARELLEHWNKLGIGWVEDPVSADDVAELSALRQFCEIPLGIGDEVARADTLIALAHSGLAEVIRVDATCAGGFSRFRDIASAASDKLVSTHVYPEIHRHAVLGLLDRGPVEMFPARSAWDNSWEFVTPPETSLENGVRVLRAPEAPGLGLELDWSRIEAATVRFSYNDVSAD